MDNQDLRDDLAGAIQKLAEVARDEGFREVASILYTVSGCLLANNGSLEELHQLTNEFAVEQHKILSIRQ